MPCFLDPRDSRVTCIPGPNDTEFQTLVFNAQSNPNFKFPARTKKLLSRGLNASTNGVSVERLRDSSNYVEFEVENEDGVNRTFVNDCSHYEPLDQQNGEIRMGLLLPAANPATSVAICIVRMAQPWTQRPYIALSYCWGPLDEYRYIVVAHASRKVGGPESDDIHEQLFAVTSNLEIALKAIRRRDQPIPIWIDALCINQVDFEERAYQVSIMSAIYANAACVYVWLGLGSEQAIASQAIKAIFEAKERGQQDGGPLSSYSELQVVETLLKNGEFIGKSPLTQDHALDLIGNFFSNPWFRRVWVLQEVWSAKDVLVITDNAPALSWKHVLFASFILTFAFKYLKTDIASLVQPWSSLGEKNTTLTERRRLPILKLLDSVCHSFACSNQRDFLFGLFEMGQETHDIKNLSPLAAPNYTKGVPEVFVDFTRWCLLVHQNLDVLSYVTYFHRGFHDWGKTVGVPSWALSPKTKYSHSVRKITDEPSFNTGRGIPVQLAFISDYERPLTLLLRGYRLDTIASGYKLYFHRRWTESNDLFLMDDSTRTYYTGGLKYAWAQIRYRDKHTMPWQCTYETQEAKNAGKCTCRYLLDAFLVALTSSGMSPHGDCDETRGIHRTKWYKTEDLYPGFAAHWLQEVDRTKDEDTAQVDDVAPEKKPTKPHETRKKTEINEDLANASRNYDADEISNQESTLKNQEQADTTSLTNQSTPARPATEMKQDAYSADFHLFCPHVREILRPLADTGNADKFSDLLVNAANKSFSATMSGRFGMVPPGTANGDIVVALEGGRVPYILRRRESSLACVGDQKPDLAQGDLAGEEQQWEFIGECFFADYMDGKFVERKIAKGEETELFELV